MINKFYPLALAAMLGIGVFAVPGGSASAAAIPAVQLGAADGNILLHDVGNKKERRWERRLHGDRYRNRRDGYFHYYDGYYYREPWWTVTVPLAVYDDDDDDWDEDHVQYCSERYRSYNPNDNTWVSYSGDVRECISPFDD